MHHDGPREERFPTLAAALARALTDRRNWTSWPIDVTLNGRVVVDEPAISQAYVRWDSARVPVETYATRLAEQLELAVGPVTPEAVRARVAALPADDRAMAHAGADQIWQQVLAAIAQGRCDDAAACAAAALETLNLRFTRWQS
jgi:hypothetical protein